MIGAIVIKELRVCSRDGRMLVVACMIVLLVFVSLTAGWATRAEQRRHVLRAQLDDQAAFLLQGQKPPHSAAHFGRMAYKPVPALALFVPGDAPYLGQVIWLEAHSRNPAMFRPAEDASELHRLADLSVAGVLALLLPLLVSVLGYGAFAAERERGTLRQLVGSGAGMRRLFAGKFAVVAGIAIAVALLVISVSVLLSLTVPGGISAGDILLRGLCLAVGYSCYVVACAAVALYVSARARDATSALLILLSLWAISVVILPRIAASVAEHAYPTPDGGAFWAETLQKMRAQRPARDSTEFRAAERQVLSRALGRDVRPDELADTALNRAALNMEISEVLGAKVFADAYGDMYATYDMQRRVRRQLAVLSPVIALQHLSSALAGTDIAAHRHFTLAAETQRNAIIRAINEDMMLHGAGKNFDYLAEADFWASIPDFTYSPPPASFAVRSAAWDSLVLALWSALAFAAARRAACRQSII